jgi:3-oxoacyl-[acyl-carrier-protein] synthase III
MGSKISAITYYLPESIYDNEQVYKEFPDWPPEKVEQKIGIKTRHIAAYNETALDLAYKAANRLFEDADKDDVDFLILCTQSPDYFLPTGACVLQNMLGLKTTIGAFDFNLGCSGYIYGLAIAKGLIHSGIARKILLITSETYSKFIHPRDKSNKTIFGDGAAATLIEFSEEENILEFVLGTDGNGMNNLIVPNGAMRNPVETNPVEIIDAGGSVRTNNNIYMNGPEIFNFTIKAVPLLVEHTLLKNNLTLESIDFVVFHQANKYMLEYLRQKIKIPAEKFFLDMSETGNTVSATIPIGLKKAIENKQIYPGSRVLVCGFGVGYSWGATVIKF